MTDREIQIRLEFIKRLNCEELRGWVWARTVDKRPPFDGEQAALIARARELGMTDFEAS